jgi:hypothetical protein
MVMSRLLVSELSPSGDPVFLALGLDWRVIAFAGAVAMATAIVFGTAPAFQSTRIAPFDALRGRPQASPHPAVSRGLVVDPGGVHAGPRCRGGIISQHVQAAQRSFRWDLTPILCSSPLSMRRRSPDASAIAIMWRRRWSPPRQAAPDVAHAAASIATPGLAAARI